MPPANIYNVKEIITIEKYIADFHKSFYNSAIQKLAFHLSRVHIIGTNLYGNTIYEAFKRCRAYQYLLCRQDYSDRVVAICAHQKRY